MTESSATAALVNWDTLSWTPGALSNSFDVDPTNPGNDVTFSLGGNTNTLTNHATSGTITPAVTMTLQGGVSPAQASLQLAADLKTTTKLHVH